MEPVYMCEYGTEVIWLVPIPRQYCPKYFQNTTRMVCITVCRMIFQ